MKSGPVVLQIRPLIFYLKWLFALYLFIIVRDISIVSTFSNLCNFLIRWLSSAAKRVAYRVPNVSILSIMIKFSFDYSFSGHFTFNIRLNKGVL